MSHIIEFEVEGLAGRKENYAKKLNRDINVFFGLNGSGKTSLLKILHAALQQNAQPLENVPFARAKVVIYSVTYEKSFTYTLDKTTKKKMATEEESLLWKRDAHFVKRRIKKEAGLRWEVHPVREADTAGWLHEYLPTTRLFKMGHALTSDVYVATDEDEEDALDLNFELALKSYWADFFGELQATVRQLQQKALVDIMNEVLTTEQTKGRTKAALDWETAYDEMVCFLKRHNPKAKPSSKKSFSKRYSESVLLRKVIARIDQVEREIEAVMAPRTKLQNLIGRLLSGGKTVKLGETSIDVVTEGQKAIGLRSLSSGEKHIFYILLRCLRADFSSIIVDEPEISMHVDWQKELIAAMRELNPRAQIIAATHSPEILADIDDSKIFRL